MESCDGNCQVTTGTNPEPPAGRWSEPAFNAPGTWVYMPSCCAPPPPVKRRLGRKLSFVLVALLALLAASGAAAQPKLTMPAPAAHPRTGEPGTWIPRWLEKEHVVDAHDLKSCRADQAAAGEIRLELKLEIEDLETALDHEQEAARKVDAAIAAGATRAAKAETKAERRARALWGTGGALAVSIAVSILTLSIP